MLVLEYLRTNMRDRSCNLVAWKDFQWNYLCSQNNPTSDVWIHHEIKDRDRFNSVQCSSKLIIQSGASVYPLIPLELFIKNAMAEEPETSQTSNLNQPFVSFPRHELRATNGFFKMKMCFFAQSGDSGMLLLVMTQGIWWSRLDVAISGLVWSCCDFDRVLFYL